MTLYSTVSDVFAEVGCISVDESDLIVVMLFVATARGSTSDARSTRSPNSRMARRVREWLARGRPNDYGREPADARRSDYVSLRRIAEFTPKEDSQGVLKRPPIG
jgi:hypothetical protein